MPDFCNMDRHWWDTRNFLHVITMANIIRVTQRRVATQAMMVVMWVGKALATEPTLSPSSMINAKLVR